MPRTPQEALDRTPLFPVERVELDQVDQRRSDSAGCSANT
jgi:hypothetical protein